MPILGKEAVTGGLAEISAIMAEPHATFQSGASLNRQLTAPGFGGRSWRAKYADRAGTYPEFMASVARCTGSGG